MKRLWPLIALVCVLLAAAVHAALRISRDAPAKQHADSAPLGAGSVGQPVTAKNAGQPLRYLAIGGGSVPESTEVSLEQNLELAQTVLRGPGALLFGGGPKTLSVRIIDETEPPDLLLARLGDLFQPRSGRSSRYRASKLPAQTATLARVEGELSAALAQGKEPLLVYIAAHGEEGEKPRDNAVALWGEGRLTVARVAALHEAHPRPLRLISASCFSGGFAELAFAQADAAHGATQAPRCGLFAGTADRETSGCDPNPDRRAQESYSLHLLQALGGADRDGERLAKGELDIDRDGRISLLEAHMRASAKAQSIDVPTTTAERYLREVQKEAAPAEASLLPEHAALAAALSAELSLQDEAAASARLQALQDDLEARHEQIDAADTKVQDRFGELSAQLLGRWPVLDDAYHPQFAAVLERDRDAIARALDALPEAKRFDAAQRALETLDDGFQRVELEEAKVLRLVRAHETLGLAAALHRKGGAEWQHFLTLLACERYVP